MKILQVIPVFSDFFGGPVFDVRAVSRRLARKHEVTIYTTTAYDWNNDTKPGEEWVNDYLVVYFPRIFKIKTLQDIHVCKGMDGYSKQVNDFDIIHLHTWRQYMEIVMHHYARKYGAPYIHQSHGSLRKIEKKGRKWLYDVIFGYRVLKDASKVIALTENEAKEYKMMGVRKDRIAIIPNGIELPEYENLPAKGTFKSKYGISGDKKIILYLGRIHKTKGIEFLIKACASLLNNSAYKNTLLVIAGPDDGYLQEAKHLATSSGIIRNVLFPGLLVGQEKVAAFVDASICAYLRPDEPFGRVSLEAAASGTPVVVSEGTPMSKIVKDGNFGFSVKYGDAAGLVNIFEAILLDEGLRKMMGECGREYVFENFDWDKITAKLENLYEQVISSYQRSKG